MIVGIINTIFQNNKDYLDPLSINKLNVKFNSFLIVKIRKK